MRLGLLILAPSVVVCLFLGLATLGDLLLVDWRWTMGTYPSKFFLTRYLKAWLNGLIRVGGQMGYCLEELQLSVNLVFDKQVVMRLTCYRKHCISMASELVLYANSSSGCDHNGHKGHLFGIKEEWRNAMVRNCHNCLINCPDFISYHEYNL